MRILKAMFLLVFALGLITSAAFAKHHTPEERGKTLFNDPKLGGGTTGKSCNSCHPNGKGLEDAAEKKEWETPGGVHKKIEDAVNTCEVMGLKGKPLGLTSDQMKDILAYIRSLKKK